MGEFALRPKAGSPTAAFSGLSFRRSSCNNSWSHHSIGHLYATVPMNAKQKVQEILTLADIELNGPDPWDLQVHDDHFYQRVLSHGSMGLGESYMDGWWDVPQLDEFFCKIHKAELHDKVRTILRGVARGQGQAA